MADDSDGGWDDSDEPQFASTGQIGVNEDERSLGVENSDLESEDDGEVQSESEEERNIDDFDEEEIPDDVPLVNLIPKNKKRKWKRTNFSPKLETFVTTGQDTPPENIQDPGSYFCKYLNDDFFKSMALYTNIREVETTGKSLNTDEREIKMFFGCCLLIGIYNLPRIRMFWQRDSRVPIVSDSLSRARFFQLRTKLKLVDDNAVSKEAVSNDRFWKVRPMLDRIQRACLQNERTEQVSIDEQMIPFHGKVLMRQYVRGKPQPVGLKNFVMTTPGGIPLDFSMYEGKGRSTESCLIINPEKLDIGGRVVLKLADTLPIGVSVFVDRFFTSEVLLDTLLSRKVYVTGTLMKNRIPKTDKELFPDKDLKKMVEVPVTCLLQRTIKCV